MTLARRSLVLFVAVCVPVIALAACGDDKDPTPVQPTVNASLIGTWRGTSKAETDGVLSILTMPLNADSTMSAAVENLPLCHITGVWTVSDDQFTATGLDCVGVTVTFVAPVHGSRLDGTWSTNTGIRGDFNVAKQ